MAKIDYIYDAVDDYGLITSAEAAELGMSNAELVQQACRGRLERVARGVYRMPVWPSQEHAPYAIAVKAAGEEAFLYGESVVALLGLANTDPTKMWVASPKRVRRNIGQGTRVLPARGVRPTLIEGVACQPVADAIASAAETMGPVRAVEAARAACKEGYISFEEKHSIERELEQYGKTEQHEAS
jgi:predicted transcriptional regulator of viral defense system